MTSDSPVVIEAAINGETPRSRNSNVPRTPGEIAADALRSLDAGASILHNHSGDVLFQSNTRHAVEPYLRAWEPVLAQRPDALFYPTMGGGGPHITCEDRYAHVPALCEAGVLRMGLGSLRYGRAFPEFKELNDAVEVKLEAKYLRPGVAVLGIENEDSWGIPELLILNSVYEKGVASISALERRLEKLVGAPLAVIAEATSAIQQVEICGTKAGVFVRVVPAWKAFMSVEKIFRASPSSEKYVRLFRYLRTHGEASNADLTELLGHSHSSQTSKFLRETNFVERHGSGPRARWRITDILTQIA